MVYSTDRSVVPVFVLLLVALWFILRGDLLNKSFLVLSYSCIFSGLFSLAITSLREERANLSANRTFVRFVLVWFCLLPISLRVWGGLWLMIVALWHSPDFSLTCFFLY